MDQILPITIVLLVGGIALISLLAVLGLMFPRPVERTRAALEASLWKSFLLGLVNFLFAAAITALLAKLGQRAGGVPAAILIFLALLLALALTVFSMLGLTGLTTLIGERIGEGSAPFRNHLRGSLLFILAGLTPYVGWFAFAPLAIITGFGAALQASVFRKKEKPAG
ncbi:MAG: hypothetical protein AB1750_07950 [Chloroflexota bacterium]